MHENSTNSPAGLKSSKGALDPCRTSRGCRVCVLLLWHLPELSWIACGSLHRLCHSIDCLCDLSKDFFLKLLMIILLFDSPVSVKDQARIRIIYFNVICMFFFLFLAKRWGCRKTGQCIKSPSAMYVVEVLPLHQKRKFLHYCWAARRRTFTKNLLFRAALLYLDTGGQCSHSWHTPSMASHSCTTY